MASYNSILRHVSLADVKRNTWKLQEQKRIDEQRRQEELDLRRHNNSPLYSNWRFDLDEGMTTQAMTYATTLPAEGDTVLTDVPAQSGDMETVEGLEADGEIKFGTIEPNQSISNWNQTAVTKSYDTRLLSTLSFRLAVGTGVDAPLDTQPLKVYYTSASGATGQLSGNLLSSGTYNFELPAAAQSSATTFKFEVKADGTYNYSYQVRYAVGTTFRGGIVQDNLADDGYSPYMTSGDIWTIINNDYHNNGLTDDQKSSYMNSFSWGGIIGMDPSPESGNADGFPSYRSERIAYYDLMRSQYAYLLGKTSRTFTVSNVGLKRRTPITVFVALDSPEASAFVRTGGFSEYSNEEKKKQLEQMMKASDDYLFSVYGDLFPGTGAVGFDDVADPTSWEQAAQGGDPYNIRWPKNSDAPKTKQYYDKHMKQWVTVPVKKASAGGGDEIAQEPSLLQKGLEKQTGGEMAPMPMKKQPTGGNMPTPSGYDLLDQDPKKTTLAKKNGKKKQPVVAHYEPEGEVIMDVPSKKISFSDFRSGSLKDVNENMTTQAMTYATTLSAEGDTNLETAINSTGINANSVESGENATVTTRGFDVTNYTTIKFNVTQLTSGTQGLRLFANYGSDPNVFYILRNDLKANPIVTIQSYYANRDNFKLQVRSFNEDPGNMATYRVSASFQRRTPITVFVALDSPEAAAFVRSGEFSKLSNEEKKKKLQDMLNAGDAYLLNKFGDPFPGTGGDYSFTDVNLPPSWEQAGPGYIDSDDAFDDPYYQGPPPDIDDDSDFEDPFPDIELASAKGAGEEPGLMRKGLKKKTGGKTAPMPMPKQPTGGNMPIVPSDYNPNDGLKLASADWPKADPSKAPLPIRPYDSPGTPRVPGQGMPIRPQDGGRYPMAKKNGKKKQPVVAHYEPEGEVIMDEPKKIYRINNIFGEEVMNKKLKKPQAFFKDKDIKPEFPENPPPPQIKGLHPDLVTGDSVSQRFNRLDPISARAMPRTGIKSVDKKVQIAKKKPK